MSQVFAVAVILLPFVAFVALVVEAIRVGLSAADYPVADLLPRAYSA